MATLSLDPILVAKINALLASFANHDAEATLSNEDIVELFESFIMERSRSVEAPRRTPGFGGSAIKLSS